MAESQAKILITISHQILLGCFDMISAYGGDSEGREAEQIVSDVLTSLILGMQSDNLIPSYETESEIYQQLDEYFPNLKSSMIGQIEEMASNLEKTIKDGDSFSEVKKEIDPSTVESIAGEMTEEPGEEDEKKTLIFSELPEKDPLVVESRGNSIKEESLLEVYSIISQDLWGTNNARRMWELVLRKKGEVPTAEPAQLEQEPVNPNEE